MYPHYGLYETIYTEITKYIYVDVLFLLRVLVLDCLFNNLPLSLGWKLKHDEETVTEVLYAITTVAIDSLVDDRGDLVDECKCVVLEGL